MGDKKNHFDKIDFNKRWEEEDWERFIQAQERFTREKRFRTPRGKEISSPDPGLSFRRVLNHFGINPDDPASESPEEILLRPTIAEEGIHSPIQFWEEGAEFETLPIYCHAKFVSYRTLLLCERRFRKVVLKEYKSESYRFLQKCVLTLQDHIAKCSQYIAAGHSLGYKKEGIKGNIVQCRRSLENVDICLGVLTKFPRKHLSKEEYDRLFRDIITLRNNLFNWIVHLRENFS